MTYIIGSDTYGRVKKVGNTAVVTSFVMIQVLPTWPDRSYYSWGSNQTKSSGVPFLFRETTTEIQGVPLARLDMLSVILAYVRAVLSVIVVMGFLGTLFSVMDSAPKRNDQILIANVSYLSLGIGAFLGAATYFLPTTNRRERDIRRFCAEELGVFIDPAMVVSDFATYICEIMAQNFLASNEQPSPRLSLIQALILIRCNIGISGNHDDQAKTNELLAELRQLEYLQSPPTEKLNSQTV